MGIYSAPEELVGRTPLVELGKLARGLGVRLLCKLEWFQPGGSAKDRVALALIREGEAEGSLRPGGTIVEATSGNTGIGLAALGAARGYRVVIVVPGDLAPERRQILESYGARVLLTDPAEGMAGALEKARTVVRQTPGGWLADQFRRPGNPLAHYRTTGPEIWQDTGGQVDLLVAGLGTGGTLTGAGRYLKERNPALRVAAVEPAEAGTIPGLGAGFTPAVLDPTVPDLVIPVTRKDAGAFCRKTARTEGLLPGISGGAVLWAAAELGRLPEHRGKTLVAILPDSGERYLSTGIFRE